MNILTVNRHETYITNLALTGHHFTVLESLGNSKCPWNTSCGEPGENIKLANWDSNLREKLSNGYFSHVITHTISDLLFFWRQRYPVQNIFIIHIALYHHSLKALLYWIIKRSILALVKQNTNLKVVAVSPWKLRSWKTKASIIKIAPPPLKTSVRNAVRSPSIMTLGNKISSRKEMNFGFLQEARNYFKIMSYGDNPGLVDNILPESRDKLAEALSRHQIFLYTPILPWNDGYNTSLLEAMESGQAVVTIKHPSSPIVHGKGGYQAKDAKEAIQYLKELSLDSDLVFKFGKFNQKHVRKLFSLDVFVEKWNKILNNTK